MLLPHGLLLCAVLAQNDAGITLDLPRFLFEDYQTHAQHAAQLLASTPLGQSQMAYVDEATTEAITHPYALQFGADHSLFITSFALDHVVRMSWTLGEDSRARFRVFARVDSPVGLAYDASGRFSGGQARTLYVSSFTADLIYAFDDEGALLRAFGDEETLDCPEGLAFGPDGLLYAVSFLRQHVARYDAATGRLVGVFAGAKDGPSKALVGPEDLAWAAVFPGNETAPTRYDLFVTSYYSNSVERFHGLTGEWLGSVGRGIVDGPVGIAVSATSPSELFVASYRKNAIHAFDAPTGNFLGVAAGRGTEASEDGRLWRGGLVGPSGLTFSPVDHTLFVASYATSHLVRFNKSAHASQYDSYSRLTTSRPREVGHAA